MRVRKCKVIKEPNFEYWEGFFDNIFILSQEIFLKLKPLEILREEV